MACDAMKMLETVRFTVFMLQQVLVATLPCTSLRPLFPVSCNFPRDINRRCCYATLTQDRRGRGTGCYQTKEKMDQLIGGLSLSDESFPNGGARGAFAKPSRSLRGYG